MYEANFIFMTDFNKYIREKYDREVQPQFVDGKWDSFVAYRSIQGRKKNRNRFFIFFISGLALVAFTAIFSLSNNEKSTINPNVQSTNTHHLSQSNQTISNATEEPEPFKTIVAPSTINAKEISEDVTADNLSGSMASVQDEKKAPFQKNIQSSITIKTKLPAIKTNKPLNNPQGISQNTALSPLTTRLPIITSTKVNQRTIKINYPPKKVEIQNNKDWMLYVYSGIAFPSHVVTSQEQAFQYGLSLKYQIHPKIRLKTGLEYGSISFVSSEMDPRIGISSIPAPNDIVSFSNAVVNSTNLNFDLGLDYTFIQLGRWKPWLGFSYRISKELYKEIDYSFEEEDNNNLEEIHEFRSNENLYFIPGIMHIESGVLYETPEIGMNLSVGYPFQVKMQKVQLLRQIQINLGVSRTF